MSTLPPPSTLLPSSPGLAGGQSLHWYALYTRSRHEKQVALQLQQRDLEFFLPLYESVRRWKDRRVKLELPLFPGYIFVHTCFQHRIAVLNLPGAVRFVAFNGCPATLSEADLLRLRNGLDHGLSAQPHPYLKVGRCVRVFNGPLSGMEGILVRRKDRCRLVISIDLIMRSIAIEVDAADVQEVA
jgi:transcription antitermination factor NusG